MSIGCCGRPTANLEALAYSADLYPRSTKAGQKARVRLALALVERRGIAQGRPDIVAKARRGLAGLGTVTPAAREALRSAGASSLDAARGSRYAADVERVLTFARTAISILQGIISAVGAANPADTGITDASNTVSWINWALGGPLPSIVADNDVRILKEVFRLTPTLVAAVNAGVAALSLSNPRDASALQGAGAWITRNWLPNLKTAVDAAYDALPPIATAPPPAPPPGGGFVVGPATGIRCPEGQVGGGTTGVRCHVPCILPSYWDGRQCTTPPVFVQPTPKSSSSVVLALPAALVLWYLFK